MDYISPPDEFLRINKAWSESQGARRRWRNHSTLFKRWVIREALQNKFRASVGIYGRYRAFADAQFDYELPESIKNVQVQIEIEVDEMALFIDLFHSATNISKTRLAVYWLVREGLGGYVLTDVEAYERELFGKHRMIKPDGLQPAPKP
ncbi:hypothetical protein [Limnobacter sp.]|uniref:hypothetical protein n=1 Tax=Limnobacter sp. TaxID=2003368 RepID=UPI003513B086